RLTDTEAMASSLRLTDTGATPPSVRLTDTEATPSSLRLTDTEATAPSLKVTDTSSLRLTDTEATPSSVRLTDTEATPSSVRLTDTEATPPSVRLTDTEATPPSVRLTDTEATPPSVRLTDTEATPPSVRLTDTEATPPSVRHRHRGHTFFSETDRHRGHASFTETYRLFGHASLQTQRLYLSDSVKEVASLIRGHFSAEVENFLIIDCRYPYEYQGGHVKGAMNLYTESQINQAFLQGLSTTQVSPAAHSVLGTRGSMGVTSGSGGPAAVGVTEGTSSPRKLIVFHCEFSSERGPRLCRYLRELDRAVNAQTYPHLLYPELYLMEGGSCVNRRVMSPCVTGTSENSIDVSAGKSGSIVTDVQSERSRGHRTFNTDEKWQVLFCRRYCATTRSRLRTMAAYKLVLIRHGESCWNQENRFCGWFDADLSDTGIQEAKRCGKALKEAGYEFDVCYTSVLKRAIRTLWLVLESIDQMWLPVHRTWCLNERHYGGLTGLNKAETAAKHGEEQVKIWRRSYDIPPPPMEPEHDFYSSISQDRRYADLTEDQLPSCESLKDTVARALPFWNDEIVPQIKGGKRVLIAAHGNSLRGIIKHLEGMSEEAIMELNLPTGIPILSKLDKNLKPVKPMQFLGDEETVRKAMEAMAAQGKAKK
ncbi:hypothetical protein QTP70_034687, partial [Hemibagrus guttatus]